MNGPLITRCSASEGYYELNREEGRSSVNMFTFTYSTQRDGLGGYFLFEIRGKSFIQNSFNSVYTRFEEIPQMAIFIQNKH